MKKKPFEPMLAASLCRPTDTEAQVELALTKIHLPVLATTKLDGIRCVTHDLPTSPDKLNVPVCRSLKQLPNDYVRDILADLPPGDDGEVLTYSERDLLNQITRPLGFNQIQSDLMKFAGKPNFKYHIFDTDIYGGRNYCDRVKILEQKEYPDFVVKVLPVVCKTIDDMKEFMAKCISEGHEGMCFRSSLYCPYKYGRSTFREQWLMKWKLFGRHDGRIVGGYEEMHNTNAPTLNERGYTERSSHKENMIGKGTLGGFYVKSDDYAEQVKIGIGFTAEQRERYWKELSNMVARGDVAYFRSQTHGEKDAPRIAVFDGFRNPIDL